MAPRKTRATTAIAKPATPVAQQRAIRRTAPPALSDSDSSRLLREAAWSRMFGRIESKNPFAR